VIVAADRRKSGASRFVVKICHECRTQTLPNGRIRFSVGVDYHFTIDVALVTLRYLHMKFDKFPYRLDEEFVPRYYDNNLDKIFEVETDEDLAMMWGKYRGNRTMTMSYHIVSNKTTKETFANDFTSSCTQSTQTSI
jgi:hypothetical protein